MRDSTPNSGRIENENVASPVGRTDIEKERKGDAEETTEKNPLFWIE